VAEPRSAVHAAWGAAFRELRIERGLSQERLAQLANLDRTYVSGIERGERNATLASIVKLADALDLRVSEIAARAERRSKGRH